MKKFNLSQTRFAWFLEKEHLFFCVALLVAGITVVLSPYRFSVVLVGIVMAAVLWVKLNMISRYPIDDEWVSWGWALLEFALFVGLVANHVTTNEYGVECFSGTILIAGFFCAVLYSIAPLCSYLMKFSDKKSKGINYTHWILGFYAVFALFFALAEFHDTRDVKKEAAWQQTQFEKVISYQTEIWPNGTVYLLKIKEGLLVVNPRIYPKVRDINKNSQVRVMLGREESPKIWRPERLEIKN